MNGALCGLSPEHERVICAAAGAHSIWPEDFSSTIREYSASEHPHRPPTGFGGQWSPMTRMPIRSSSRPTIPAFCVFVCSLPLDGKMMAEQAHPRASANPDAPPTFPTPVLTSRSKPMADDRTIRGSQDRQRINMSENYEAAYWPKKWGIS